MLSYSPYDNVERAGLSGDVRRHRPVGLAGAVLRAGQVGGAAARRQHRRRSRCCSAPTWRPATAASRAASAATASWRRCTRSCSTSWACVDAADRRDRVTRTLASPQRCEGTGGARAHSVACSVTATSSNRASPSDAASPRAQASRRFRWAWWLLAYASLGLGLVGIVRARACRRCRSCCSAAFAAARGSQRLHRWLLAHPPVRSDDPRLAGAGRGQPSRASGWRRSMMAACAVMMFLTAPRRGWRPPAPRSWPGRRVAVAAPEPQLSRRGTALHCAP